MDFGLGLVLSLTDRASSGIYGAITAINGLENACNKGNSKIQALGNALSSLSSLGAGLTTAITAPITAFMGKLTQYGVARASFIETSNLAFTSLMSDAQKASDYMQKLMSFAKTTPYTYESITSAAQTLLTFGMQENDILTETNGKFSGILQALGDWAGATGRGEQGLIGIANVLGKISAEGRVNLDRLYQVQAQGLNAIKIIGNMYGLAEKDAQEFIKTMSGTQFINDLVKGIEEGTNGINGATGKMAGQMENLKNTWMGAKDTFVSAIKNAGLQLMGEYTDKFGVARYKFLDTMTQALNDVSKAIKLIPSILQPIVDLIQNSIAKGSALILKMATAWGKMSEVTQKRLSKLLTILTLSGPALVLIGKVGGGLVKLFNNMNLALLKMLPTFARFGLATGLLAVVWKSDFAGIRTNTTAFCEGIKKSFETAEKGVNGSVTDMQEILAGLDRDDFFDGLTLAIMRVQILMRALVEGWDDYTLSEDTFLKAKELGILPLIESLFDLKYRLDLFFGGFKRGFKDASDDIRSVLEGLAESVKGTALEGAFDSILNFFDKMSNNDPQAWGDLGYLVGQLAAKALILAPIIWLVVNAFKALSVILPIIITLFNGVVTIFSGITTAIMGIPALFAGIGKVFSDIIGFFQLVSEYGLSETLTGLFGGVATTIAGIASVVIGAITAIASFVDMLVNGFSWLKEILMVIGIALTAVGAVILGVPAGIAAAIAAIVAAVATAVVLVVQYWDEIVQFFSDAWTSISTALAPVGAFFSNLWNGIVSGFTSIFKPIWDMLVGMWNSLVDTVTHCKDTIVGFANHIWETIKGAWDNIMSYIQPMIDDFNNLAATFKEFADFIGDAWLKGWQVICDFFSGIWTAIEPYVTGFFEGIWAGIVDIWTAIYEAICPILNVIWDTICGVFTSIWDGLVEICEGIWDFLVGIFNGGVDLILGPIQGLWQFLSNTFQAIMNLIMGKPQEALENLKGALMGIVNVIISPFKALWDIIKGALSAVWKGIEGFVKGFVGIGMNLVSGLIKGVEGAWNGVVTFFKGIIDGIVDFVCNLLGIHSPSTIFADIGNFLVQGLKNGIENAWNMIVTLFTTVLNGIKTLVTNIFNGIKSVVETIWNGIKTFFSNVLEGLKIIFSTTWETIKTVISTVFNTIKTIITTVINTIQTVISTVFNTIKTIITTILDTIRTVIFTIWNAIKSIFVNGGNGIKNTISTIFNAIKTIIDTVLNGIKKIISTIWNSIKTTTSTIWNGVKTVITTVWNGIKTIVSGAINNVKSTITTVFNTVKSTISTVWNNIKSSISSAWDGIKNLFNNAGQVFQTIVNNIKKPFNDIANWFKTIFTNAWTNVKNVFSAGGQIFNNIKDGVLNGLKNVINFLIRGINNIIAVPFNGLNDVMNRLRGINIAGINPFSWLPSFTTPEIPYLAEGGIVTKPTTAVVGEAGREAIVPLENNTDWIENLASMITDKITKNSGNKVITPIYKNSDDKSVSNVYNNEGSKRYYTRNINERTEENNTYDYSVVFSPGAIQIIAKNSSDEEARRMAVQIMEIIKRQQELDNMMKFR